LRGKGFCERLIRGRSEKGGLKGEKGEEEKRWWPLFFRRSLKNKKPSRRFDLGGEKNVVWKRPEPEGKKNTNGVKENTEKRVSGKKNYRRGKFKGGRG